MDGINVAITSAIFVVNVDAICFYWLITKLAELTGMN